MALDFLSPLHKATRQIGLHLQGPCLKLGVSPGEGHLIAYLKSYGPCPIGELHRVFGTKRSTLTSMLDRLSDQGLIDRRMRPEDRRSVLVELTRRGRRLAVRIEERIEALETEIGARVGSEELRGFRLVMSAIAEATGIEVRPATSGSKRKRTSIEE
jgi:DNA-binding MarR family transcriptional regulator